MSRWVLENSLCQRRALGAGQLALIKSPGLVVLGPGRSLGEARMPGMLGPRGQGLWLGGLVTGLLLKPLADAKRQPAWTTGEQLGNCRLEAREQAGAAAWPQRARDEKTVVSGASAGSVDEPEGQRAAGHSAPVSDRLWAAARVCTRSNTSSFSSVLRRLL